jgi:integrase
MAIVKLTQSFIASELKCPAGLRRTEFVSDERSGLYIEVRNTNKNESTYYWRSKNSAGKTCHTKLGRTTEISLADARKKVMELKLEISNSSDSNKAKVVKKGDMLLNDLWTEYFDFAKSTKRSWKRDEQLWRIRIQPRFGHLKLSEITLRLIQTMMMDIRKEGLSGASADHHGQLMRRLGNMAVKWGYIDVNFARGIQLYHEFNGVENIPDDKQLQKLINVLNTDDNRPISQLVLYLLSTGCRLNEALSAQWKNVSIQNKLWTVPHESSKSKRPRTIPLNDSALSILKLIDRKETDTYVFTNAKTQKPFVNVFKPWNRIRTKAGLPQLRLHDLRHMYATFCVNNGCTIFEVSQLLGHADTRVSQRYSHLNTSTMLTAANSVSKKLSGFMLASADPEKLQEAA